MATSVQIIVVIGVIITVIMQLQTDEIAGHGWQIVNGFGLNAN